jgi:glycosyltransferase involved in cell wall biosynthesis
MAICSCLDYNNQLPVGDDPFYKSAVLKRPEDFGDDRPLLSLHLLVKNGESCVPRLLDNVGRYVDEVVAVVNDTTDRTLEILGEYERERRRGGRPLRLETIEVSSGSHPQYYVIDEPSTYEVGESLTGESCPGPFTRKPLLADWSAARNLGWRRCTKPWILFLDADDVVVDPESIWGMCAALEARGVEVAATRYIYDTSPYGASHAESYRERLARNYSHVCWEGPVHEVLRGSRKTAHVEGNLVVRDCKDSSGKDVRVPGRCMKVLYHHARVRGWRVPPRILLYLALESRGDLPDFALELVERYLDASMWPEERAWACAVAGEILEERRDFAGASAWYERSLSEYPGSKSAYRLCRTRFRERKWRDAVDAYEVGVASQPVLQLLDGGPAYGDMSKILVASAWEKLGETRKALVACEEALAAFPGNTNVVLLRDQLRKQAAEQAEEF